MIHNKEKTFIGESVLTRLAAFAIAIITGSILYTMFFELFVGNGASAIWLAVCCAIGSAILIDRTIARARDLIDENGRLAAGRGFGYALLVITCAFVFVLDRGAEIFVMNSRRTDSAQNDRKKLEEKARAAPAIKAREVRVNWLRTQVTNAAKSDSANAALARVNLNRRSNEIAAAQRSLKSEIRKARERGDEMEAVRLQDRLNAIGSERVEAQKVAYATMSMSRTEQFTDELAREDSMLNSELNSELKRIAVDADVLTSAGFKDNPIGFILKVAPSSILWAIVVGLLLSAAMSEKTTRRPLVNRGFTTNANLAMPQTSDMNGIASAIAASAGVAIIEEKSQEDNGCGPFPRGDLKLACEWLWYMVLSDKFQTNYKDDKSGDFAFALRRACGDIPARRMSRQKSKLYRSLTAAKKFKESSTPEAVRERLKQLSYFDISSPNQAQLIVTTPE